MKRFYCVMFCVTLATLGCQGESADDLFAKGEEATHNVAAYPEAEIKLAEFIDRFPDDPRADIALQALARVLMNQQKNQDAIARYEELLKRLPDSRYCPQAQFMIGYIHDQDGRFDAARQAYQSVIDSYPASELADDAKVSIANMGKTPKQWLFPGNANTDSTSKS